MTGNLESIFLRDAVEFLRGLDPLLARFESGSAGTGDLDEAFRLLHSIKSEAAHLGKSKIADHAHRAESALQELKGNISDSGHLNQLYLSAEALRGLVLEASKGAGYRDAPVKKPDETGESGSGADERPLFSDFELTLLAESRDRGEYLYRMVCDFDEDTEMKYAKAVLILNNLEQQVNVIRTDPELTGITGSDFNSVSYFFSSHIPETELFKAVSVDQVRRVFLSRLAWEQHLPDTATVSGTQRGDSVVLSQHQMNLLWFNMLRSRIALWRMDISGGDPRRIELESSLVGLDEVLQASRMLSFGSLFADLPAVAQQAAEEQSIEVRCEIEGKDLPLERWLAQRLRDSLIQIVRNAVSHGIEERNIRLKAGKSPRGEIRIRYERTSERIRIVVKDDGRGIDEGEIRRIAMELGLDSTLPLLRILTSPGFSTSVDASLHSGRGVGLDIVASGIERLKGAELTLELSETTGTSFVITLSHDTGERGLLFLKQKERVLAVEKSAIIERESPDKDLFSRDADGRVNYRGKPVYTCDGYLFWIDGFPEHDQLLLMRRGEDRFYLLVEEILFEENFPPDLIRERAVEMSPLSRIMIGSLMTDIDLLRTDSLLEFYKPLAVE